MTVEEVKALCFEHRPVDYSNVDSLHKEDLEFAIGDMVYFRPLREIVANPRVTSCRLVAEDTTILLNVDDAATCRIPLSIYDSPRMVQELENYRLDEDDIDIWYYLFANNLWADEYMLSSKPPISKKQILLNSIKGFR